MPRRIWTAAALTMAVATASTAAEPKTLVFERTAVKDRSVEGPVCTILKPKGWEVESKVTWIPTLMHQANIELKVSNAKGTERYRTMPTSHLLNIENYPFKLERFDPLYSGLYCETMAPNDLFKAAYEKFGLDGDRKKGKIVDTTELPEVAKQYSKAIGVKDVRAGKTRMQYEENGTTYEEDFYMVYAYATSQYGGNSMTVFSPVIPTFGIRAEKGKLEAATPRLLSIAHSFATTKEFELVRAEGVANLNQKFFDRLAAIDAISKQVSANNDSMIALIRSEREARWAREDRAAKKFSDYISGVEGYTDGKSLYTVPSGYSNVWSDGQGAVILSNESDYDPNRSESGTWKTLKQTK